MMARAFPTDVVVLDSDSLILARFGEGRRRPQLLNAKKIRIASEAFAPGPITPVIASQTSLADSIKRIRMETGKLDQISLLLPDSWFRMNLIEVAALPEDPAEATEVVRWTLKRTLPLKPEELRTVFEVISRDAGSVRVLVVSALEATLATIERMFAAEGISVVLIEPTGINIWNAVISREEADSTGDRIFFYAREHEFTTAIFRGSTPVFFRSRILSGERTLEQEIRLSASYIRGNLKGTTVETCYLAGNRLAAGLGDVITREFNAPVRNIAARDIVEGNLGSELAAIEAELTACAGVFTS
ncbi:MAG TPA: hypothetical protein VNM92_07890 [Thermoanaerobaculia bacterium]|nr:hypothetical protein [Thermoanaerobaculia bacterium]